MSDPEVVRITRTEYLPVPAALTAPTPAPAAPEPRCRAAGAPVFCNGQLEEWRGEYAGALDRCNADKAAIGKLPAPGQTEAE